jgi:hypothetical protein
MTAVMTYGRSYNFSHSPYLDFPAVKFLIIITKPHAPPDLHDFQRDFHGAGPPPPINQNVLNSLPSK